MPSEKRKPKRPKAIQAKRVTTEATKVKLPLPLPANHPQKRVKKREPRKHSRLDLGFIPMGEDTLDDLGVNGPADARATPCGEDVETFLEAAPPNGVSLLGGRPFNVRDYGAAEWESVAYQTAAQEASVTLPQPWPVRLLWWVDGRIVAARLRLSRWLRALAEKVGP